MGCRECKGSIRGEGGEEAEVLGLVAEVGICGVGRGKVESIFVYVGHLVVTEIVKYVCQAVNCRGCYVK